MNIDILIFVGFLGINLILGLASSKGVKTIKEYAIGDRNFSTATVVATIVATWISGEFFYSSISEAYVNGLHSIWIAAGDPICLFLIGVLFAPRMGEFLGKLSIAEAMGDLFGNKVRIVTAISGFVGVAGIIAAQLKMAGLIFEYAIGMPSLYGVVIATIIVTLYSTLGGIKSVTFTDIIQFFTFGTVIPLITYAIFTSIDNADIIMHNLRHNELYDIKAVFDFSQPLPFKQLFLFIVFVIAGFNPAIFQRVTMCKNTKQVKQSFIIAAVTCLIFAIIINWGAVLLFAINPSLQADEVLKYAISNCSHYVGLKGAIFSGVIAMIMSTVDSFINSTAILVVHDFCKPLKMKFITNELLAARIVSLFIGISGLALSLYPGSLLELLIIGYTLYMPIVIVPFVMAVFGFRSTEKSVLLGMASGLVAVFVWDYVLHISAANSVPFAMLTNLVVLLGSHYLLKQPGGWVGIKDKESLIAMRNESEEKIKRLIQNIQSFDIIKICTKNCPKSEGFISILGVFVMISAFISTNTLEKDYHIQYKYLLDILYPITLCASTVLITYPLWFLHWKRSNLIAMVWNVSVFSILICYSFFVVLISQVSTIQLLMFAINIVMLSLLMTWRFALCIVTIGITITVVIYNQYIPQWPTDLITMQFKVIYSLLLIITAIVIFIRPKHKCYDVLTEQNDNTSELHSEDKDELNTVISIKNELLTNLNHELHTPIVNIINLGQLLDAKYDDYSEKKRRHVIREIANSSVKLEKLIDNIFNLSKISSFSYQLNKLPVDLSKLIVNSLNTCKKIYKPIEGQEFILNLAEGVIVMCDEYFIHQTLDNLISNAIKYCKKGKIVITLTNNEEFVEFGISDEGIGVHQDEVCDIFGGCISNKAQAGSGVGLVFCKKAIESHNGKIWIEENQNQKGAIFKFIIPKEI